MATAAPEARAAVGARRRRVVQRAQRFGVFILFVPALFILAADLARRGPRIARFSETDLIAYVSSAVGSGVFWAALVYAAAARRGRLRQVAAGLFAALFAYAVGVQGAFASLYNVYLTRDAQARSSPLPFAIAGALPFSEPAAFLPFAFALAFALAFLVLARRLVHPRRVGPGVRTALVAVALLTVFVAPISYKRAQPATFDLLYLHGLASMLGGHIVDAALRHAPRQRGGLRTPTPIAQLHATPQRPRNVLILLEDDLRADVTCIAYDLTCQRATQASNRAAPGRLPLLHVRANSSTRAIALANLWSGVDPTGPREALLSAPLVWEYAAAAGYDTAYWTSENLMFESERLYVQGLPLSHRVSGTELDAAAPLHVGAPDALLTDRVVREIGELEEPYFAVVHYTNINRPRRVDLRDAPFQPTAAWDDALTAPEDVNRYKNAVVLSDRAVARLIAHVRGSASGARTVIMFTSPYAESYREHMQEDDHGASLFDEELRVPAWIDAPTGTLSAEEEQAIRGAETAELWQFDLFATTLDLLGVWDAPEIAALRARTLGLPVTREERSLAPMPLTNVSRLWEHAAPNWGMMVGPLKVLARPGDTTYRCFDLARDPRERREMRESRCQPLVDLARARYHVMPIDMIHVNDQPTWGRVDQ